MIQVPTSVKSVTVPSDYTGENLNTTYVQESTVLDAIRELDSKFSHRMNEMSSYFMGQLVAREGQTQPPKLREVVPEVAAMEEVRTEQETGQGPDSQSRHVKEESRPNSPDSQCKGNNEYK